LHRELDGLAVGVPYDDWAADGKGFFISSNPIGRLVTLLYVDLAGNAASLWQVKNFQAA
jgi:hypothetical protein